MPKPDDRDSPKDLRTAIQSLGSLPPMPEVLAEIWRVADDPHKGAAELAALVANDPALMAEILKLVNSSFFGLSGQVHSVRQAVTLVGAARIKNLSIAILVKNGLMPRNRPRDDLDRTDFWRHSIGSALAAEQLARRRGNTSPDLAFSAGLLHDVGIMVLDIIDNPALQRVARRVAGGDFVLDAEQQELGCTHAEIGRLFAESWTFPPELVEPIACHHQPQAAPGKFRDAAHIVHLADQLMSPREPACYSGRPCDEERCSLDYLRVDASLLQELLAKAGAELGRAEGLISLVDEKAA